MNKNQKKNKDFFRKDKGAKDKRRYDLRDEFDKRVEKAWESYEKGRFKSKSAKEFLEELDKC